MCEASRIGTRTKPPNQVYHSCSQYSSAARAQKKPVHCNPRLRNLGRNIWEANWARWPASYCTLPHGGTSATSACAQSLRACCEACSKDVQYLAGGPALSRVLVRAFLRAWCNAPICPEASSTEAELNPCRPLQSALTRLMVILRNEPGNRKTQPSHQFFQQRPLQAELRPLRRSLPASPSSHRSRG